MSLKGAASAIPSRSDPVKILLGMLKGWCYACPAVACFSWLQVSPHSHSFKGYCVLKSPPVGWVAGMVTNRRGKLRFIVLLCLLLCHERT